MTEVTSKDSKVKLNQATTCLLGRLTKFTIYFLQLILNVRVNNRELWQFMFREVYTTITIHRTVFQYITTHGHQKWSITASRKYPCPRFFSCFARLYIYGCGQVGQWDNFQWHNYYIHLVMYSLKHRYRPT